MVYILLHHVVIVAVYSSVDRAKASMPMIDDWEYSSGLDQWETKQYGGYTIQVHTVKGNLHESCG